MSAGLDPFDELADLFLTGPEQAVSGSSQPRGGALGHPTAAADVELIVVGNLPVRASLWLVPYADACARETGPVGLIRLDDDTATLQVLRAPPDMVFRPWPSLGEAIEALCGHVASWAIRPGLDDGPLEITGAGVDRITILSSANDSAIVDAYRRAKAFVEAAEASGAAPPALGVAVLGAPRHRAEEIQRKLNQTTREHLRLELPLVACVQQMDADIRATDRVAFPDRPKPPLPEVLEWIRAAGRVVPAPAPVEPVPRVVAPEAPDRPAVRLAPKPGPEVEPKELVWAIEPDEAGMPVPLAEFVTDVTPLDVRCPGHERLELAVDVSGRMHVIARETELRDLHVVAAWATAHHELIARACPEQWIDPTAGTVCHVFTQRPASLADLQGSDLRLHVLASVIVEGRQGWYAAPLNAEVC